MTALGVIRILIVPAAALALAACSSAPSASTIRGDVSPDGSSNPLGFAMTYAACAQDSPAPGAQVTVTDPGGKVVGSGTLGTWTRTHVSADAVTGFACDMPFTMTGVPAEQRYGFRINGVPGTIWMTSVSRLVTLSVKSAP